ncbi:MAG: hypothetical protein JNJ54_33765 [Myxococcaceae bacterium]|nr:hypothetical protein [Myxococcaceae bacterium]
MPALLLVAACRTTAPAPAELAPAEPAVNQACLDRARAGTLLNALPPAFRRFEIATAPPRTIILHRAGRPMTRSEGVELWRLLGDEAPLVELTMGNSGLFSGHKCPGVADGACLAFSVNLCAGSLESIAVQLELAAAKVGAGDAELHVTITVNEADGPFCKDGPRCVPTPHYSTKDAVYRPTRFRVRVEKWSLGACRDDGDCEGPGNSCHAWYRRGGVDLLVYVQHDAPTFCGCVNRRCTWFTQE